MAFPIAAILGFATPLLDKLFPDPEQRAAAQVSLIEANQRGELAELDAAMSVVVAEAKSEHWIVAAWRPIIMLMFGVIIANNYIVFPYLNMMFSTGIELMLPPDLWMLMKIGLGGYVVGRSGEKMVKAYKGK